MNNKTYYVLNARTLVKPEREEPCLDITDKKMWMHQEAWDRYLRTLPPIEIEGPDIKPGTWYRKDQWEVGRTWTYNEKNGYGCAECCNGDRCDEDCTAKYKGRRKDCPFCKGKGWLKTLVAIPVIPQRPVQ
jgi:hypothetical protein